MKGSIIMEQISKSSLLKWIDSIRQDLANKGFSLANDFAKEWITFCNTIPSNICGYSKNISDASQGFRYQMQIGESNYLSFDFQIDYIRSLKDKLIIVDLEVINGQLFHNNFRCYSNKPCKSEIKPSTSYSDLNEIYMAPFFTDEYLFIIIDGNHRLASLMEEGRTKIQVKYCNEFITAFSLDIPLQTCAYLINVDYHRIKANINKFSDEHLLKISNIRNQEILNIIKSRISNIL